jgi:hypothetical protein
MGDDLESTPRHGMTDRLGDLTVDRRAFSVSARADTAADRDYWLAQPVEARLRAIEVQRQIIYGPASAATRLQRVLEIAQRARR